MTDRHEGHFEAEDERMLRVLAGFAAACWVQWKNWDAALAENRRRDEMFTTLIHELRSPLAAITAAACVIERTAGLTAAGGQPAIEVVKRQSRVLSRIVDDLSDLSRIGRDKLELRLEWLEIHPIIADAVLAAQPRITSRRQKLQISVPREEIRCHVDAVRLAQILINLLDNASKYTPDGGHIELAVVCRPRTVDLTVRDDGVGIPPTSSGRSSNHSRSFAHPTRGPGRVWASASRWPTSSQKCSMGVSAPPVPGGARARSSPFRCPGTPVRTARPGDVGCDGAMSQADSRIATS